MGGTSAHNMIKPLEFTFDTKPKEIQSNHIYNGCGLEIRDNSLNMFKELLEASPVAGALFNELTPVQHSILTNMNVQTMMMRKLMVAMAIMVQ